MTEPQPYSSDETRLTTVAVIKLRIAEVMATDSPAEFAVILQWGVKGFHMLLLCNSLQPSAHQHLQSCNMAMPKKPKRSAIANPCS